MSRILRTKVVRQAPQVLLGLRKVHAAPSQKLPQNYRLSDRKIVLRSLREGIDTSSPTRRMVAGGSPALPSLSWAANRRAAAREACRARGQHIGRPKALDKSKSALALRMHASGESASTIAATLGVSRATVYRVLAEQTDDED